MLLFVMSMNYNAQNGATIDMSKFEESNPPPPNFGGDGPGAPSDAPTSPIDAYTVYLVAIGGIMIFFFRKRIFTLQTKAEEKESTELAEA